MVSTLLFTFCAFSFHVPGVSTNPQRAKMPAWHPWFKCNKELYSASESCLLAVLCTAAFPEAKSVCNAWSDTHWQPAQTFPAWLQWLQRQGEIPVPLPPCLTWHFLIKALNLGGRGQIGRLGQTEKTQLKLSTSLHLPLWSPSVPLPELRCEWEKGAVNPLGGSHLVGLGNGF